MEKRWLLRLGPPLVAVFAASLLASASAGAIDRPWDPPECGGNAGSSGAAALPHPGNPDRLSGEAWFRLDPVLDASGTLAGQRLEVGRHGAPARHIALPPESFAAGPFGRLVLVGADDGRVSTLRAIDTAASCARLIAREPSVVRRAVIDPTGVQVYEFRVDRATRTDLGVWRRPLAGGAASRVLAAAAADERFGRTYSTELAWSLEGDRLVVQQCGYTSCRTRLLEPVTGRVATIARPELGELVGAGDGRVVVYAACHGLPCPILSVDPSTGRTTIIATTAGLARLVPTGDGPRLVHETGPDTDRHLRSVDLAGASVLTVTAPAADLRLVPAPTRALAGTRIPAGWILLAPDGRRVGGSRGPVLVRLVDGLAVTLREVTR
ncbi:MAG TPA: hypothetical protein VGQ58_03180 [Candidatus Limnocylindrales bacterium]|nr:hypothetical protein [Candidatus Limnocylindrales bacterium]